QYIYDVERRIDARISFKYAIPLAVPVDEVINQITRRRTAYDIYVDIFPSREFEALPEAVKEWRDLAESLLQDIITGSITLTVPTTEGTGIRAMTSHLKRARKIEVRLTGTDWQYLGYEYIVPDSFIATSTIDISTQYVEGTDYEMMWKEGAMRLVEGTSIEPNSIIYLYFLYQETPEYQRGIRREDRLIQEGDYI
ncbi:unnamed protein product, partial [marine sediment metagenome]